MCGLTGITCHIHFGNEATDYCSKCFNPTCGSCLHQPGDGPLCESCAQSSKTNMVLIVGVLIGIGIISYLLLSTDAAQTILAQINQKPYHAQLAKNLF